MSRFGEKLFQPAILQDGIQQKRILLINEEIDALHAGSGHTYRQYKYSVHVHGDGSVLVNQGDWLSKFSFAIHGNPWQVHE